MAEDKTVIDLTIEAAQIAEKISELNYFEDFVDIAKFALAYAIKNNLDVKANEYDIGSGRGKTWNIGTVDGDRLLYNYIVSFYPGLSTPYRKVEQLMNVGLIELGNIIERDGLHGISEFM